MNSVVGLLIDLENSGKGFGLSSSEFRWVVTLYVHQEDFNVKMTELASLDWTHGTFAQPWWPVEHFWKQLCDMWGTSLVFCSFGAHFTFLQECTSYFAGVTVPSIIILSSCFATHLCRSFQQNSDWFVSINSLILHVGPCVTCMCMKDVCVWLDIQHFLIGHTFKWLSLTKLFKA